MVWMGENTVRCLRSSTSPCVAASGRVLQKSKNSRETKAIQFTRPDITHALIVNLWVKALSATTNKLLPRSQLDRRRPRHSHSSHHGSYVGPHVLVGTVHYISATQAFIRVCEEWFQWPFLIAPIDCGPHSVWFARRSK